MDDLTHHRLKQTEKYPRYRLDQSKKNANKKKRKQDTYQKIREYFDKLTQERAMGKEYKTASAIGKKRRGGTVCPHCGLFGHKTTRSKKCLLNPTVFSEVESEGVHKTGGMMVTVPEDEHMQDNIGETELATMEVSLLDELPCTSGTCRDLENDLESEMGSLSESTEEN